ncbi:OLC1v1004473C1 [Oldenlandia corymbosa var. corymbosa]|uniref:OLC1v1004473C1 n=1 Tax=Oldenlandia corymbosa var. corymbosa TaxID=529605 RepID=A0AAV1DES9_OLDCO|nr:OLC1v1004473C1 [Oldenlandia corymbosa var. corymbosa]
MDQQQHQYFPQQYTPTTSLPQQQWTAATSYQQQQQPQQQVPQMWYQQQQQPMAEAAPQDPAAQPSGAGKPATLWIGDLQPWMDENFLVQYFCNTGVVSAKVIRNKQTGLPEGYGFLEFRSLADAQNVLPFNGSVIQGTQHRLRLNWVFDKSSSSLSPEFAIFVGDLAPDVTDFVLLEAFRPLYPSVKGANVVFDKITGRSKGYGFVKFGDESEQNRALVEMNGVLCSTRPMRIGPATNKKAVAVHPYQQQQHQKSPQGESDPNNTTLFVGGLEDFVAEEYLRQLFGQYGEVAHVKLLVGKRCGFVQFTNRAHAELALVSLNGFYVGAQPIRVSWGRSPANKQSNFDEHQQTQGAGGRGGYYDHTSIPLDQYPARYSSGNWVS